MNDYSTDPRASSSMRRVSSTGLNPPSAPATGLAPGAVFVAADDIDGDGEDVEDGEENMRGIVIIEWDT